MHKRISRVADRWNFETFNAAYDTNYVDPGTSLRLLFWVTDESTRDAMAEDDVAGRIPHARITAGYVSGRGWGFLPPWAQRAVGRHDDPNRRQISHKYECHEPFLIIRLWSRVEARRHFLPRAQYQMIARFYRAIVWRSGRGWSWTECD